MGRQPNSGAGVVPGSRVQFEYALSVSANGRFLQNGGAPLSLDGDTPWNLATLSPTDSATYWAGRSKANAVIIEGPVSTDYIPSGNYNGDPTFTGTTGGQLDISTPSSAYFARVRAVVLEARARKKVVFFFPLYIGFSGSTEGFKAALTASGSTKAATYGTYIGNLLRDCPNIVWCLGGDYMNADTTTLALVKTMSDAIKAAYNLYPYLVTWHCEPNVQTFQLDTASAGYRASLGAAGVLNWAYTYENWGGGNLYTSKGILDCWNSSPNNPSFMGEAHYEFSPTVNGNFQVLRRQHWSARLSGGCGVFFGQEGLWNFQSGWQSLLNSTGSIEKFDVMDAFFATRRWDLLAPSQSTGLVSSGGGSSNTAGYKSRALATDGSWGAIYVADGSATTIDFGGGNFNSTKTVKWLDPTVSPPTLSTVGTHAASGTQSYTPSGNNATGGTDWILVIE